MQMTTGAFVYLVGPISGSLVYIIQPNGSQVVKTRKTVQINGEELSPDHAVRKYRERNASA